MNSFSLDRFKKGVKFFFGIFFSRLFGFLRDIVMAFFFGGNFLTDAFNLAYKIPNLFRQVFGESMYERAFMPPFNRLRNAGRYREARMLLLKLFLISQVMVVACMGLVYLCLPWILDLLAAGFDKESMELPLRLSKLFLPYMLLISLATFCGALLRYTHKREFLYGFSPSIQNILLMLVMVGFYKSLGIFSMVWGYLLGSLGFFLVQAPSAWAIWRELGQPDKPDQSTQGPEDSASVRKSMGQGGNIFTSALLNKSIDLVDAAVASLTGFGAISALAYSRRIIDLPITLFGMAFSALPFSKAVSDLKGLKDTQSIPGTIATGIKTQVLLIAPVSLFCLFFSTEIMTLFFKRGAFDDHAVQMTAFAFSFFAIGMVPMGLRRFFAEIFPAIENARPLVWVSLIGAIFNITLDLILYQTPLKHGGIALATSISYIAQSAFMLYFLIKGGITLSGHGLSSFMLRTGLGLIGYSLLLTLVKVALPENLSFLELSGFILLTAFVSFALFLVITLPFLVRREDKKLRLLLTGGGTGGHVYPSLAIYDILNKNLEVEDVCYLGMKSKPESTIVAKKGLTFYPIVSAPVAGLSPGRLVKALPILAVGTLRALLHILRFNPNTVVASGGYVSAPVVVAAAILRPFLKLQIVLHEQNLVPGFMNKVASLLADLTFVNFRESAFLMWNTRCVHAGYPVRKEFLVNQDLGESQKMELRERLGIPKDDFFVLVFGGSIGARSINRSLAEALPELAKEENLSIVHGIGLNQSPIYHAKNDTQKHLAQHLGDSFDATNMSAANRSGKTFYRAFDYLHDLGEYQKVADLIICRAGAGALTEILALGRPALVIPKRGLPGNHQELNAIELKDKDACDLLFESWSDKEQTDWVDPALLVERIRGLRDNPEHRMNLAAGAKNMFFANTEQAISDAVQDYRTDKPVDYITTIEEPAVVKHQRLFDSLIEYLQGLPEDHILRQYYRGKADEFLQGSHFLTVNKGIKLMTVFPEPELFEFLFKNFKGFKGFLKRNSLTAIRNAPQFQKEFCDLVRLGLADSYFETRREAIATYRRFFHELKDDSALKERILALLNRRLESFEVRVEAIRASVLFLSQSEFEKVNRKFLFSQNMRLRYGLLLAVEDGLALKLFDDIPEIRKFVKQILLTNADFVPNFKIREQFKRVAATLRARPGQKETPHDHPAD